MPEFNPHAPDYGSAPLPPPSDNYIPQFSTVQYLPAPGTETCANCSTLLTSQYFVASGKKLCPACAQLAIGSGQTPQDHAAFVRAVLFGIGGAIAGMVLYAGITIAARGWTISYLALAVGWLIAKAMLKGSGNRGGRHYQIVAALLTYAAISLTYIPIYLYILVSRHIPVPNWTAAVLGLLIHGIVSPFLSFGRHPAWAVLNLFILFIGVRIAWQLMRAKRIPIAGPYKVGNV